MEPKFEVRYFLPVQNSIMFLHLFKMSAFRIRIAKVLWVTQIVEDCFFIQFFQ